MADDDHAARSSAAAHQSEHRLIAGFPPVPAPSATGGILSFGAGPGDVAVQRALRRDEDGDRSARPPRDGGLAESAIVRADLPGRPRLGLRRGLAAPARGSLVAGERLPAAIAFARANAPNRVIDGDPRLAIVTAGKAYRDIARALSDLGGAGRPRIVRLGTTWPLDRDFVREACERRTMNVAGMGAEGLPWIGAHRFVETGHVFASMGDRTYAHWGGPQLAARPGSGDRTCE